MNLTPEEEKIILELRDNKIEFGRMPCIFFYQNGQVIRMEIVEKVKSKAIKS